MPVAASMLRITPAVRSVPFRFPNCLHIPFGLYICEKLTRLLEQKQFCCSGVVL